MQEILGDTDIAHLSPSAVYFTSFLCVAASVAIVVAPWVAAEGVLDFIQSNRWGVAWIICVMILVPALLLIGGLYVLNFSRYSGAAIRQDGDNIVFISPLVRRLKITDLEKKVILTDRYLDVFMKNGSFIRIGLAALTESGALVRDRLFLVIEGRNHA